MRRFDLDIHVKHEMEMNVEGLSEAKGLFRCLLKNTLEVSNEKNKTKTMKFESWGSDGG